MGESAYLLTALGLCVVLTASLVIVGLWVGYYLGKAAGEGPNRTPDPSLERLLHELAYCEKLGDRITRQVEQLSRLTAARKPRDMATTLRTLQETTRSLSQHLQLAGQGMRGPKTSQPVDLEQSNVPQSKGDAVKGNSDLSARELGQFTEVEEREMESHGDGDRRRYGYDCLQRVVPWDDPQGPLPSVEASVVVRCHDISMQGVSFFWPEEPEFEHLLISLGNEEDVVFMAARVVHCKRVYTHGQWAVMVSCRFTKRMREFTEQWKQQARTLGERLQAASELLA